jgi:dihydrofolate reductase
MSWPSFLFAGAAAHGATLYPYLEQFGPILMMAETREEEASVTAIKFIYYFASSSDGFIADADGGVEWLNAYDDVDYGWGPFMKSVDALVIGRTTYEQALTLGPWPSPGMTCVVLSKTRKEGPHVDRFWSEPLERLPEYLAGKGAKRVWMMGGGAAAASFLNAGLLDEIEQQVMPIVLGSGIPAYGKLDRHLPLALEDSKAFKNGVVTLKYRKKS